MRGGIAATSWPAARMGRPPRGQGSATPAHKEELANHHTEPGTSRRELAPDPLNSIME